MFYLFLSLTLLFSFLFSLALCLSRSLFFFLSFYIVTCFVYTYTFYMCFAFFLCLFYLLCLWYRLCYWLFSYLHSNTLFLYFTLHFIRSCCYSVRVAHLFVCLFVHSTPLIVCHNFYIGICLRPHRVKYALFSFFPFDCDLICCIYIENYCYKRCVRHTLSPFFYHPFTFYSILIFTYDTNLTFIFLFLYCFFIIHTQKKS